MVYTKMSAPGVLGMLPLAANDFGGFVLSQETAPGRPLPAWAQRALAEIRNLEILAGNIPSHEDWQTRDLAQVLAQMSEDSDQQDDPNTVDALFSRLMKRLQQEGFSVEEMVSTVNANIGYKGGPPYCNAAEVLEALNEK